MRIKSFPYFIAAIFKLWTQIRGCTEEQGVALSPRSKKEAGPGFKIHPAVFVYGACMHEFSLISVASSHSLKTWQLGLLNTLKIPLRDVCACVVFDTV